MKLWDYAGKVLVSLDLSFEADVTCVCGRPLYLGTVKGTVILLNAATR